MTMRSRSSASLDRPSARLLTILLLAAGLLALLLTSTPRSVDAFPSAQAPEVSPSARAGRTLYEENCAPCHGDTGLGDGPAAAQLSAPAAVLADPDLARRVTPAEWFLVTKEGRMERFMPPWKNRLTDAEIWDVVAYALTLHVSTDELAQGEAVWGEQCAACHGELGAGDGPQGASPAMPDLTDPALVAERSLDQWYAIAAAGQGAMPGFAASLPEADLRSVVAYARNFGFQPVAPMRVPPGEGRIAGNLVNASPGGGSVAGLTVTLRAFQHFDEMRSLTTTVAEDGTFSFDNLTTASGFFFVPVVEYLGLPFNGDMVAFEEGGPAEVDTTVQVWEGSDQPGAIGVTLAQWFVEYDPGALLVGELYRFDHQGDYVFMGGEEVAPGKRAVLTFELPPGAVGVDFDGGQMGDRFIQVGDKVYDTRPLPPGQEQLIMRYLLPYGGTRAELAHPIPYPVNQLSVLAAQGPTINPRGIAEAGSQEAGDRTFLEYRASNLPVDQEVGLAFRGLVRATSPAGGVATPATAVLAYRPDLLAGIAVAAALAGLGVLILPLLRRQRESVVPSADQAARLTDQRQQLLQAIADLDDGHLAGTVDDVAYARERQALKRALVAATRQVDGKATAKAQEAS